MNFNTMTIKRKLYLSYGLLLCAAIAMGVSSIVILTNLGTETAQLGVVRAGKLFHGGQTNTGVATMISSRRAILSSALRKDMTASARYQKDYLAAEQLVRDNIVATRALGTDPTGKPMIDQILATLDEAAPIHQRFFDLLSSGHVEEATAMNLAELVPVMKKAQEASDKFVVYQRDKMATASEAAQSEVSFSRWLMSILLVVGLVIGGVLIFVIRGLDAQLRQSVIELNEGANQTTTAATEVASSSQSLAREASEQAAMIEETSASAAEINSMAQRNAQSASSVTALALQAVETTVASNRAIAECVLAMDAIADSSNKISKTLTVIDKIAFQTNILALNAAVEAARAGEAGMGFAVVAEEVRNLAQRCAEASQETSGLVELSLNNSNAGRSKIGVLVQSGEKVDQVFAEMKVLVEQIGESSQEQGRGIDQIGRAIAKMEQGTQKSAANAEESAAAAEQLNAQSESLRHTASTLSLMVGISARPTGNRRSASTSRQTSPRPSVTHISPSVSRTFSAPRAQQPVHAAHHVENDDSNFMEF
jgi:methyl-accepting chemotaxis protein/methyl-accepting chemotaxis protein-1 (serine sensor receptor)